MTTTSRMRTNFIAGKTYGILTAIEYVGTKKSIARNSNRTMYEPLIKCICICGTEVIRFKRYIRAGHGQHCGSDDCKRMARWLTREAKKLLM